MEGFRKGGGEGVEVSDGVTHIEGDLASLIIHIYADSGPGDVIGQYDAIIIMQYLILLTPPIHCPGHIISPNERLIAVYLHAGVAHADSPVIG